MFMVTYGMLLGFEDCLFVVNEKFSSSKLSVRDSLNAWSLIIVVVLVFMFLGLFLLNTQFVLLDPTFLSFVSFWIYIYLSPPFLNRCFYYYIFINVIVQLKKRSYV